MLLWEPGGMTSPDSMKHRAGRVTALLLRKVLREYTNSSSNMHPNSENIGAGLSASLDHEHGCPTAPRRSRAAPERLSDSSKTIQVFLQAQLLACCARKGAPFLATSSGCYEVQRASQQLSNVRNDSAHFAGSRFCLCKTDKK